MNDMHVCSIDNPVPSEKGWPNYLMGVVDQLYKMNYRINGFNCVFGGDIPIGAGMSSSAAIEAGLAFALNNMFGLNIEKLELVKLAQRAENIFVGVKCGIMDQFINIFGNRDNVLRIDCRSLEYKYYPFAFDNISIVLFDTCVSHSLASSEYNKRREECGEGIKIIKNKYPECHYLRDVSVEILDDFKKIMDPIIYKRCKYVVEENDRLLKACVELEKGDLKSFGVYMNSTHEGLSKDYEVSCAELDFLSESVINNSHVYGSRMMGGGFGGCTINLIDGEYIEEVKRELTEKYRQKFKINLKTYITQISTGTGLITIK
jgi:galactokinase